MTKFIPAVRPDTLRIKLLGPFEVVADGKKLALGGARQARLLTVLALNSQVLTPYGRIAEALWDAPPDSMRQQIHNAVRRLRNALGTTPGLEVITGAGATRCACRKVSSTSTSSGSCSICRPGRKHPAGSRTQPPNSHPLWTCGVDRHSAGWTDATSTRRRHASTSNDSSPSNAWRTCTCGSVAASPAFLG